MGQQIKSIKNGRHVRYRIIVYRRSNSILRPFINKDDPKGL